MIRRPVATYTDANGKVATYTYNIMGWLVEEKHESATETIIITRTYLSSGLLQSISDGSTLMSYEYDDLRRVSKVTMAFVGTSFTKSVQYEYDLSGNRTQMIDPEGAVFSYAYDNNHRLTSITRTKGGGDHDRDLRIHADGPEKEAGLGQRRGHAVCV